MSGTFSPSFVSLPGMARRSVWLAPAEQAVLDQVRVRLITPDEQVRWDDLIATRHYLKNATLVGEQLRDGVEHDGQWLALLGWSAAAYHLKDRDTWLGWSNEQRPLPPAHRARPTPQSRFPRLGALLCPTLRRLAGCLRSSPPRGGKFRGRATLPRHRLPVRRLARAAFDENLTHYKQQIPALFWYNALLIASNGMDSHVGSLTASPPVRRKPVPRRCGQRCGGSRRPAGSTRTFYLQKVRSVPIDVRG